MTRLPFPDAPNRATMRQLQRAAIMTGSDVATTHTYFIFALTGPDDALDLKMASNIAPKEVPVILRDLAVMFEEVPPDEEVTSAPEQPGHN